MNGSSKIRTRVLIIVGMIFMIVPANAQTDSASSSKQRAQYHVNLSVDLDKRSYTGTQRVRWINQGDHAANTLFFHLYPNVRVPGYLPPNGRGREPALSDEPRVEITEVRASGGAPLTFALDDQETILRVNLREAVAPDAMTEIAINFKGNVPEIDPEETGLVTRVVQQADAAIRGTRELRRARDTNFRCRGVMMLGSAYPVLAARDGDDWMRRIEVSIGDTVLSNVADYDVTIEVQRGVAVFTPVAVKSVTQKGDLSSMNFAGESLRDFAMVFGRELHSRERTIGDVTIRSIYRDEHEVVAGRVLDIAAEALRVYTNSFGPLPVKLVSIVDAPLVATLGSAEFTGLSAIASAFYLDFDSTTIRNMPEVIREQRAAVEDSLEWSVANVVAHQWWGAAVGNDPGREPVLHEALANWSALHYYREARGEERAKVARDEQLCGVYKLYRTFGGEDMEASRAARDYRNSFQYAAIVTSKGALMFEALRKLMGDEKFLKALRNYYRANVLEVAGLDDLRGAFMAETSIEQRRTVTRTFDRWLSAKRGDEDIAPPDPKLAADLGLPVRAANAKGDGNLFSPFGKVGKFFWQQMTKIR